MAQRSTHVPKFGDWNTEEDIPYTSVFENARVGKGAGGKIINPNDPEENPTAFAQTLHRNNNAAQLPRKNSDPEDSIPGRPPPFRRGTNSELNGTHVAKPRHEKRFSREDGGIKGHVESPALYANSPGRRGLGESPSHQYAGGNTTVGESLMSNTNNLQRRERERGTREHHYQSQDQSPVHQLYQGGLGNKPGAEAMLPPSTTGRMSQGGNMRAGETPGRGESLPKFGAWNESNPASADGYTYIFNKAREEKQTGGATKIPTIPPETPSHDSWNKKASVSRQNSSFWCCFKPRASD